MCVLLDLLGFQLVSLFGLLLLFVIVLIYLVLLLLCFNCLLSLLTCVYFWTFGWMPCLLCVYDLILCGFLLEFW